MDNGTRNTENDNILNMKNSFYNGPKIEIGEHYIKIKKKDLRLSYSEIKSADIKNTRSDRFWLVYIIAGIIIILIFLYFLFLTIQGLMNGSSFITGNGHRNNYKSLAFIIAFLTGVPLFIISRIKKYFRKYPVMIIVWKKHEFRIKISELGIKENELKSFIESKVKTTEV
jgi:hypothetical protein